MMSWGTRSQNSHDAVRNGRHWQVNKTRCKWDHPLSGDNLKFTKRGHRQCRACLARRNREYLAKKALANA